MRPTPLLAAAVGLALVLSAGCGGQKDKSAQEIRSDLAVALEGPGIDQKQAECLADLVIDEAGISKLRDVKLGSKEPPAELQDDIAKASLRATTECDGLSG